MQKQNLQTLKGFRDFLPSDVYKRQWVKDIMIKTAEAWGYEPIETPTLESYEVFKGEIGEDEKLFFKFTDNGGREVMLRYDQTVPTCRYVATNQNSLTFPFRRYQTQSVFRAENPQHGRYREFTQFDLDIFGVTGPSADAEVIAVNLDTLPQNWLQKTSHHLQQSRSHERHPLRCDRRHRQTKKNWPRGCHRRYDQQRDHRSRCQQIF